LEAFEKDYQNENVQQGLIYGVSVVGIITGTVFFSSIIFPPLGFGLGGLSLARAVFESYSYYQKSNEIKTLKDIQENVRSKKHDLNIKLLAPVGS
jgi:hypothetical protein